MAEWMLSLAFRLVLYALVLPASLVLATPVIWVRAAFTDRTVLTSVVAQYKGVVEFWVRAASSVV